MVWCPGLRTLGPDEAYISQSNQSTLVKLMAPLIARFMGPTWGPSGTDRTQVGRMLAPWTLLSGSSVRQKAATSTTDDLLRLESRRAVMCVYQLIHLISLANWAMGMILAILSDRSGDFWLQVSVSYMSGVSISHATFIIVALSALTLIHLSAGARCWLLMLNMSLGFVVQNGRDTPKIFTLINIIFYPTAGRNFYQSVMY